MAFGFQNDRSRSIASVPRPNLVALMSPRNHIGSEFRKSLVESHLAAANGLGSGRGMVFSVEHCKSKRYHRWKKNMAG